VVSAWKKSMSGASPARANRRAVIIGGSMSGLFSAALLSQIGWDVDVYERSSVELIGRGAGITGHPELFEALEASGAGTKDLGVEVPKRIAIDRDGRVTDERPLRQILTSWDRLQRLLRATIGAGHTTLAITSSASIRKSAACAYNSPTAGSTLRRV
jgi:2-polyprenyl-6-methoxyphenol hydroxylase-like FAD-dependent oxidoreductase